MSAKGPRKQGNDGSQFNGKRTGRPKGSRGGKKRNVARMDIEWAYKNLGVEEEGDLVSYPRDSALVMWRWAKANEKEFMKRVMSLANVMDGDERGEVVEEEEDTEKLVEICGELLRSWERGK